MPEIRLTIPGSVRIKKNSRRIFRAGSFKKNLPSKAYCAWEDQARAVLWPRAIMPPPAGPVHIEAHFFVKGPLPDLSGALESCGDMLQGLFYQDDRQITSWDGSRVHHDLRNPRTEVIIRWGDGVS